MVSRDRTGLQTYTLDEFHLQYLFAESKMLVWEVQKGTARSGLGLLTCTLSLIQTMTQGILSAFCACRSLGVMVHMPKRLCISWIPPKQGRLTACLNELCLLPLSNNTIQESILKYQYAWDSHRVGYRRKHSCFLAAFSLVI